MLSIPVRLFKAARRERIRFQHVYRPAKTQEPRASPVEPVEDVAEVEPAIPGGAVRDLPEPGPVSREPVPEAVAPVHNLPAGEFPQDAIEKSQVLKGYEIEKDRYVTFTPQEVAALRPATSSELEIAEFVRLDEIDPLFFETSYYVSPDPGGEKAYALLFRALVETGYAAIGSLAMHGREHATAIRPGQHGLILHTLFYANEVRANKEYRGAAELVVAKELELAKLFVRTLAARFDPNKLKDAFEERLHEAIRARSETAVAAYIHGEPAKRAPVVDIMEALRRSLEIARKPVKSERADAKHPRTRSRRR